MKCFLLLALSAATAFAGDWQETLTTKPGTFAPLRSFRAHYHFGWTMFTAAEADFDYARKKDVGRITVAARSIGVVRTMWRMDTEHTAKMRLPALRPISVVQMETYKSETEKTKLDFTPTGVTRLRESSAAKEPGKAKTFEYPEVFDLHSALHFIRSQKLAPGDICRIVVYPATAPYLAEVEVQAKQKLKAAGQVFDALRLGLRLWKIEKDDMSLQPHDKFKHATVWLSDDADRVLLRVEAEIMAGSVWGEIDKIEWRK